MYLVDTNVVSELRKAKSGSVVQNCMSPIAAQIEIALLQQQP